jgi:alpha-ketoglutarate-dependent taurine dioxygenase
MTEHGVALHRGPLDRASFFAIAAAVGNVFHQKSIFVDPAANLYIRRPDAIPFHTDHARANVVAWLCEVPEDCFNCYVDAARVFAGLTPAQRTALRRTSCYCPYPRGSELDPSRPAVTVPVATDQRRFFWVPQRAPVARPFDGPTPWVAIPDDAGARRAIDAFGRGVDVDPATADVAVKLERGHAIFVDNNRFLHGRAALAETTPRLLYRLWINTDGWASAKRHHLAAPAPTRDDVPAPPVASAPRRTRRRA